LHTTKTITADLWAWAHLFADGRTATAGPKRLL